MGGGLKKKKENQLGEGAGRTTRFQRKRKSARSAIPASQPLRNSRSQFRHSKGVQRKRKKGKNGDGHPEEKVIEKKHPSTEGVGGGVWGGGGGGGGVGSKRSLKGSWENSIELPRARERQKKT